MEHGSKRATVRGEFTRVIGLDLSDRKATFVELDGDPRRGEVLATGQVRLTTPALQTQFGGRERSLVVIEAGTHSRWVDRLLQSLGHAVLVANPRQVKLISQSARKTDRTDAETLARLARVDPALLRPIEHRSVAAHRGLQVIRARAALVRHRTGLVNHVRGAAKADGVRLPACSPASFPKKARLLLAGTGLTGLYGVLLAIAQLTKQIARYDRTIAQLAEQSDAACHLQQVPGVGALTALCYVLTVDNPRRFGRSRTVGAYLGLTRREASSGEQRPELSITKAGDTYLRQLLVQCAHRILGPFGADTDLRRWGLALAGEGSGQRKKRAVVAVARKLAVLLHRLWISGEAYRPFKDQDTQAAA
jgi:transposase